MRGPCENSNCTFNATGSCVVGNSPEDCSHRPVIENGEDDDHEDEALDEAEVEEANDGADGSIATGLGGAVLSAPDDDLPTFPASRTLGIQQANAMMEDRPTCLVGIVGLAAAGKTAALVSAYLMLAQGQFEGFSYADSDTLRAFEEIARASRTWDRGNPPEQITSHTTLSNDREAGFLHLRLRRNSDDRLFDILLPDLPGEWSRALIDRTDEDRLNFLGAASVIWLMVDGRQFADDGRVANARYRATLLIERLANLLGNRRPRIIVVPTWQDKQPFPQDEADRLAACGAGFGFDLETVPIASFSWNEEMDPGHGIPKLFAHSLAARPSPPEFWPETDRNDGGRQLAAFRRQP
ncbi:hypothetical protein EOC93_23625 [Mesorhizobium sp. M6A.T.Ce.TU.002.03.1.1]|uniref:TRAFAC clade GTPase domain-containing protein n=1 Tax=Mesorhizobium sp. M6A.T.Ce.TU.002.03.1.1 TaxID=2496782 RepID=UPI000FCC6555|nr:hypothetical protein [Mesorhizobium sp. M6A.T.Ce.TU.002.03.1.1]RUU38047.1 hypothetical protein EOC93_23625 [Mesorhizobium sp. M6A.T.Ce.TU.002.03.1.1]